MATGSLVTGKIAIVMFEKFKETYESQQSILPLVTQWTPDAAQLQNAANQIWRPYAQHAPIISGWDLTGLETGIIQQTYPAVLGTPSNDFVSQRIDDMRDEQFWKQRAQKSAQRQASYLNQSLASAMTLQGSMFYRSSATNGLDFISEAQALMNERQLSKGPRNFLLNDRTNKRFANDLGSKQTMQGRPESDAWVKGQIGNNVAEFDLHLSSSLPNLVGGASPSTTVTGNQSFAPTAGTVDATTGVVTNVDARSATIPVAASASYNIGDKVTFVNGSTPVYAVGLDDKTNTGNAMTFTIIAKPSGTSITVFPRPIANDDAALSTLQKSYSNIDTTILSGATVVRQNTVASERVNLFWEKTAVEVLGGEIPAEKFKEFSGKKVITDTMSNGLQLYMVWDGDIATMTFSWRLFVWWGITVADPSQVGVAINYTGT